MTSQDAQRAELDAELAASLPPGTSLKREGSGLYKASVAGVSGDDVILELGPRVQGIVPAAEFDELPEVGTAIDVAFRGREDGLWTFSIKAARSLAAWEEVEVGSLVKGTVVGLNKGGLELKVSGVRAFLPASQVALHHVDDLSELANQTLVCEVLEVDREKRQLVVSRRAVLEDELSRDRQESVATITEGAVVRGKVTRLEKFGAFVQIAPGIEGLLHVSNISHKRVENPDEVLKVGEELEVQILEIKEGGRRIGLGKKQLDADPWDEALEKLHPDAVVTGKVQRLVDFGAFVELLPGVDGLLHVSQLGVGRVNNVREVLSPNEELAVRVLSIDPATRRISLSRLDPRGALLGSEEAAEAAEIDAVLEQGGDRPLGTNLGALFKRALEEKR